MSASTIIVNDETPRRQYTATSGQTVFDFPIPFFEEGDLTVYLTPVGNTADDTADLLTITTDYTVNGENTQDGGEIVLTTGATTGDIITIVREVDIARTTDYQAAGDLLAETLNREQDINIMIAQQLRADHVRLVSRAVASASTADLTLPDPDGNYILGWNAAGDALQNFQEIGTYQGTDATTTTANYVVRDLVKDSSNNNVYICTANSASGTTLTNTSYWKLIVDAAAAASSASSASDFADEAEEWATKTDGIVESTDYSSKAWSIGGTGVTTTSGKGAAKEWATSTGAAVDTSEYSAKEYAVGDLTASGGSAKAWAIDSSSPDGSSEKSAKTLAGEAATSASNAATSESNAADWAVKTDGIVDSTDYAAKAWSIGGTGVTDTASAGAAKEWATKAEDSTVDGTEYSAKHYAAKAAASATTAAAAVDLIESQYLGAQASAPTLDLNGDALTAGDWYFNTTANLTYIYNGSSWQVTVIDTSGFLAVANNLSDLGSAATALTNLGLTATATELNYTDGVTSAIQTQLDAKMTPSYTGDVDITGELTVDSYNETYAAVTSSSNATTVDCEAGNTFMHTLTENTTFTFSNPPASGTGYTMSVEIIQDASASGYTVTWPTSVDWAAATAPTLTATASAVDVFVFTTRDGGTTWYGFTAGQALA